MFVGAATRVPAPCVAAFIRTEEVATHPWLCEEVGKLAGARHMSCSNSEHAEPRRTRNCSARETEASPRTLRVHRGRRIRSRRDASRSPRQAWGTLPKAGDCNRSLEGAPRGRAAEAGWWQQEDARVCTAGVRDRSAQAQAAQPFARTQSRS
jgi:hypothetical protein